MALGKWEPHAPHNDGDLSIQDSRSVGLVARDGREHSVSGEDEYQEEVARMAFAGASFVRDIPGHEDVALHHRP